MALGRYGGTVNWNQKTQQALFLSEWALCAFVMSPNSKPQSPWTLPQMKHLVSLIRTEDSLGPVKLDSVVPIGSALRDTILALNR
ncbi:hypothetical protein DPEC_G00323190 [Dallia pectoralis]|uniref:Uncharacterized protein n=1 Tax=Dallia pectoralis TaxID=75939 RepID=A0ACC2FAN3_DALPE|nr:hypothetical protein DPEC_G00323190 [Dallia pectoralis]